MFKKVILFLFLVLFLSSVAKADIGGNVYREFPLNGTNANTYGIKDANEPGINGVTVIATDSNGNSKITQTDSSGNWSIVGLSGDIRVEFKDWPTYLSPTFKGNNSKANVRFVVDGDMNINFGLHNPGDFANPNNIKISTSMFPSGDPLKGGTSAGKDAWFLFDWLEDTPYDSSIFEILAKTENIGSTWGQAYQKDTKRIFASAALRRHSGMGSFDGVNKTTGGIYVVDLNKQPYQAEPWLDLNTLPGVETGDDPRVDGEQFRTLPANSEDPSFDTDAFLNIAKIGIGDIDISEDDRFLYAVNLFQRTLLKIDLENKNLVDSYQITDPGCVGGEYRPWALEINDGEVYVGVTCTAEYSQDVNDLSVHILKLNNQGGFDLFFSVNDLSYERPPYYSDNLKWKPWNNGLLSGWSGTAVDPMPLLTDIEFGSKEEIYLGINDAWAGLKIGDFQYRAVYKNDFNAAVKGIVSGDLLKVCKVSGNWVLENNGECGGTSGSGISNLEGPGGGEFFEDINPIKGIRAHDEGFQGGLSLIKGSYNLLASFLNPNKSVHSGGVSWFSTENGKYLRGVELYPYSRGPESFSKAGSIGDVELLTDPAPLEIGDRVWRDEGSGIPSNDNNGLQDPEERGIAGVVVRLESIIDGVLYTAEAITDANGYYSFKDNQGEVATNFPGGILPRNNIESKIIIDVNQAPLSGIDLTSSNVGNNDDIDSDGEKIGNQAVYNIPNTGFSGQNNYSYDFGFSKSVVSLGNYVWLDENADGIQDIGESGLANVTVRLLDSNGNPVEDPKNPGTDYVLKTDNNGYYLFEEIKPGQYYVEFDLPATYHFSPKNKGNDNQVDSDANLNLRTDLILLNENRLDIDAGVYQKASVGDYIWYDSNANGIQDNNEKGIENIELILFDINGNEMARTTTDSQGKYLFDNLDPGIYKIKVNYPNNYILSLNHQGSDGEKDSDFSISTKETRNFELISGQTDLSFDGGLYIPASLGNYVWEDLNGNGIQDNNEKGVPGVVVSLLDINNNPVKNPVNGTDYEVTTDIDGKYLFENLPAGEYKVKFNIPTDYILSPKNRGGFEKDSNPFRSGLTERIILSEGENNLSIDAGLYLPTGLGDLVWEDSNNNGIQDNGERGIEGVKVSLYYENGEAVKNPQNNQNYELITDQNGNYLFKDLAPGNYYVLFEKPNGYEITKRKVGDLSLDSNIDSNLKSDIVNLEAKLTNLTIDAGFFKPASLSGLIWIDLNKNGLRELEEKKRVSEIKVKLFDENNNLISEKSTDKNGFYLFDKLNPGRYYVKFDLSSYKVSPQFKGDEKIDSDINILNFRTDIIELKSGDNIKNVDAGINYIYRGKSRDIRSGKNKDNRIIVKKKNDKNDNKVEELKKQLNELTKKLKGIKTEVKKTNPKIWTNPSENLCIAYLPAGNDLEYGKENNPYIVKRLQEFLNKYEKAGLEITSIYDKETVEAVNDYQRKYWRDILFPWRLNKPTSTVFSSMRGHINKRYREFNCQSPEPKVEACSSEMKFNKYLFLGSRGKEVEKVQNFLKDLGFYKGPIDGIYDEEVKRAVQDFQNENYEEILKPWGIPCKCATGYWYQSTLNFANKLIGCEKPLPKLNFGKPIACVVEKFPNEFKRDE